MVLTGPAKQVKHTLVYIVAGGFVSERSEHFAPDGLLGNGETRLRARKGMRLVAYEPKACTPKPRTSCAPSIESSSQGYSHGSMQYFWMTVGDTNAEAYSSCHPPSMVVGWQRRVPIRKGARVDSNGGVKRLLFEDGL